MRKTETVKELNTASFGVSKPVTVGVCNITTLWSKRDGDSPCLGSQRRSGVGENETVGGDGDGEARSSGDGKDRGAVESDGKGTEDFDGWVRETRTGIVIVRERDASGGVKEAATLGVVNEVTSPFSGAG